MNHLKLLAIVIMHVILTAGNAEAQHSVVFYNVENLFDCIDDPPSGDDAFTPEGEMQWEYHKYQRKLRQVFQVLAGCGNWESPALVGLCEIEKKSVLEDLLSKTHLGKVSYRIVHRDSRDHRGIDAALLVREDLFQVLHVALHPVVGNDNDTLATRDILEATLGYSRDTISVFVNHWPSRRGGVYETRSLRLAAAQSLIRQVQSLPADRLILIMGDFNCGREAPPMRMLLEACRMAPAGPLRFPEPQYPPGCPGTYQYQAAWETIDHILFGKRFQEKYCASSEEENSLFVYAKEWMLEEDFSGGVRPRRTFKGPFFAGGTSDHLPLVLRIKL